MENKSIVCNLLSDISLIKEEKITLPNFIPENKA
jgi:hypothetical protein